MSKFIESLKRLKKENGIIPSDVKTNLHNSSEPLEQEHNICQSDYLKEIAELETIFNKYSLPIESIQISKCETITDVSKFVEVQFKTLKANPKSRYTQTYIDRLNILKDLLTINKN